LSGYCVQHTQLKAPHLRGDFFCALEANHVNHNLLVCPHDLPLLPAVVTDADEAMIPGRVCQSCCEVTHPPQIDMVDPFQNAACAIGITLMLDKPSLDILSDSHGLPLALGPRCSDSSDTSATFEHGRDRCKPAKSLGRGRRILREFPLRLRRSKAVASTFWVNSRPSAFW